MYVQIMHGGGGEGKQQKHVVVVCHIGALPINRLFLFPGADWGPGLRFWRFIAAMNFVRQVCGGTRWMRFRETHLTCLLASMHDVDFTLAFRCLL